ncbi:hypothetical protein MPAR168_09740 [Methylorubrum populi]
MRALATVLLTAVAVSGCSFLPAAGPTTSAIEAGADVATAEGLFARYEIIDVTPAVVEALRTRPLDSLLVTFGDNRPAVEPVIGVGDAVAVQVWEAGSGGLFSGPLVADRFSAGSKSALIPEQIVGPDGSISVPYAGRIKVAGRRTQDVQTLIESELAGKAIQPQVLVSVTKPVSRSVTVTGEASTGGRVPLTGRADRLLDVIALAGGVRTPVAETFVRLSRGNRTVTVPMSTVVANPRENIFVRPDDTLTLIESELAGKAIQPQVLVSVTKPVSRSVTVTGEASTGGRVPLTGRADRLLDVIALAGGVRTPVAETFVRLSRGNRTVTVPMSTVVANPRENIFVRPDDTLTLVRDPQTFLSVGALGATTEVPFSADGLTLSQALARASGLRETQADPEGVFLFRYEPAAVVRRLRPNSPLLASGQVPVVYRVNLRDPQGMFLTQSFRMRNRDLVYVSSAPFAEVGKVLGVFSTVAAPVASGASLYSVAGLRETQADPEGVFLFRYEPAAVVRRLRPNSPLLASGQVPVVYRVNLRDPQGMFLTQSFRMRNRDLVYVSSAPFAEVGKVLGVFSTVAAPVASGASLYSVAR